MRTNIFATVVAALFMPQLVLADPWKDESGHGRWAFQLGRVQIYVEPPWLRGGRDWDGYPRSPPPPPGWDSRHSYGRPGVNGYLPPPPYPPPYDLRPPRFKDRDDYEDWLEKRQERLEKWRERQREAYEEWLEDYEDRMEELRERERERFKRWHRWQRDDDDDD